MNPGDYWVVWRKGHWVMGRHGAIFQQAFELIIRFCDFFPYSFSYSEACQTPSSLLSTLPFLFSPRSFFYFSHALGTMTLEKAGLGLSLDFGTY